MCPCIPQPSNILQLDGELTKYAMLCSGDEYTTPWDKQSVLYWAYELPDRLSSREAVMQHKLTKEQVFLVGKPGPTRLTAEGQHIMATWGVPELARPAFCDALPENLQGYARFEHHPCNYLPH